MVVGAVSPAHAPEVSVPSDVGTQTYMGEAFGGLTILAWHVHGSWMTSFVSGPHTYLLPAAHQGGPWLRGRAGRPWPATVRDADPSSLKGRHIDLVVLQRPEEVVLAETLLGKRMGRDVPAVYVEHNAPRPGSADAVHPLTQMECAPYVPIVHVTHFNRVMWDNGSCRTMVIEHGIPDPGAAYSGELPRLAAMINEPGRRKRVTGSDLLGEFSTAGPVDLFGMGTDNFGGPDITGMGDVPPPKLHELLAQRRVYVHTARWTSLGLSLLEAMYIGMPVVVLAATEAASVIPPAAGCVSANLEVLTSAARELLNNPEMSYVAGKAARAFIQSRFSLDRFVSDWNTAIAEITEQPIAASPFSPTVRKV